MPSFSYRYAYPAPVPDYAPEEARAAALAAMEGLAGASLSSMAEEVFCGDTPINSSYGVALQCGIDVTRVDYVITGAW